LRAVDPGSSTTCAHCSERIKFTARTLTYQVIANVYKDGSWDRVEHFHGECYELAGLPHGDAQPPTHHPSPRVAA